MSKKIDPKVAEEVMLKAGLKPLEPFNKASYKWKSVHIQCGEIVYPTYSSVKRGRGGYIIILALKKIFSKKKQTFTTIEFCRKNNLNYGSVKGLLKGRTKTHKGFTGTYL
jgi:hypothetical protein